MWLTHAVRRILSRPYAIPLGMSAGAFVGTYLAVTRRRIQISFGLHDPLTHLASRYRSDKGITIYPFHGYSVYYARLFHDYRERPINVLEIGLARQRDRNSFATTLPSLEMWIKYFPHAAIYGFDIDDFSSVQLPRTTILQGNQGNVKELMTIVEKCPRFDIVIDDGSHASYHQQVSLETLFPYVTSGGFYIIEDLDHQPETLEASLPKVRKTVDLFKDRVALDTMISGVADVQLHRSPVRKLNEELGVITKA